MLRQQVPSCRAPANALPPLPHPSLQVDQEELAAKRKMVESWLSSQAAAGGAGGGAAGTGTIPAAGGGAGHTRGRSGGAAGEVLAGSPPKMALVPVPDVALALGDEPGGKPAGKANSMADDSSQPDSEGTSGVRLDGWVCTRPSFQGSLLPSM